MRVCMFCVRLRVFALMSASFFLFLSFCVKQGLRVRGRLCAREFGCLLLWLWVSSCVVCLFENKWTCLLNFVCECGPTWVFLCLWKFGCIISGMHTIFMMRACFYVFVRANEPLCVFLSLCPSECSLSFSCIFFCVCFSCELVFASFCICHLPAVVWFYVPLCAWLFQQLFVGLFSVFCAFMRLWVCFSFMSGRAFVFVTVFVRHFKCVKICWCVLSF